MSTFLYIRTGNLIACIASHGFCNHMGFPDLVGLYFQENGKKKAILMVVYVAGVIGFFEGCKLSSSMNFSNQLF